MTTEEKAKAYDEALERAKQKHGKFSEFVTKTIEEIFPEISESEDEKLYKKIEQLIRLNTSGAEKTRLLAYLEKHKESLYISKTYKENADSFTDKDERIRELIIDRVRSAKEMTNGLRELLLAYLEQKPAEKQDYSGLNDFERAIHRCFLCAGVKNVPVTIIKETAKECLGLKPTEQDSEEVFDKIDKSFRKGREVGFQEGVESVKPAEWSEEDETAFGDLLWCIEQARHSAKDENDMGNIWYAEKWLKERLKSLRPSWKPSEEQMEALLWCVAHLGGADHRVLAELYEHLKMLNDGHITR